jgi:hypothetical protein
MNHESHDHVPPTGIVVLNYGLPLDSIDLINSSQAQLEMIYAKHHMQSALKAEYVAMGAAEQLEAMGIPVAFGLDLMVQAFLHKKADVSVFIGILHHHFKDSPDTADNPMQACADMILKACENDVVDHVLVNEGSSTMSKHMIVVRHDDLDPDLLDRLDQLQYPLPMIEEPTVVTNNKQTGYKTIRGSMILKGNHTDEDICLDHINRVNQTTLSINPDVVAFVQNRWKNLDRPKPGEDHKKFAARKKAFEKYDRVSREVIEALLAHGNKFWLTHRYDKRGRTYSQGYHVNYQGADWNKAAIEFANAETLNQE